jgi:hypothetical protein
MPVLDTIFKRRYDVSMKRLEICTTCEHYVERTSKCEKCGCFMEYKSLMMNTKCPIEKWKEEIDE